MDVGVDERVMRFLSRALAQDRLPHALLFLGPKGSGRERAARAVARALLCTTTGAPGAFGCGECSACRRVESGSHPDVHLVAPEQELARRGLFSPDGSRKPSRDIRIEQVRTLAREMRLKPYEGRGRVAIVVDAHRMTDNAANALLKTLEEPGAQSALVLIAPHERALLPTIASRAARLRFTPPRGPAAPLPGPDDATAAAITTLHASLVERSPTARLKAIEDLGRDREHALAALDGLAARLTGELRDDASAVAGRRREVLRWLDGIEETRKAILGNAHVQLALEELVFART